MIAKLGELRLGFREKLAIWIFAVTVIAIAVNYISLVPRLESQLEQDRVQSLEQDIALYGIRDTFQSLASGLPPTVVEQIGISQLTNVAAQLQDSLNYRIRIYEVRTDEDGQKVLFSAADSSLGGNGAGAPIDDPVALHALQSGHQESGVGEFGGVSYAEVAFPTTSNNEPNFVVVVGDALGDVKEIVDRLSGRILIAGLIALVVALLVGMLAARTLTLRVRRLQRAALDIAQGNFTQPLPVDSTDELGELARAFNTMQDRLGRSDRARKAFIATASHELRTPLFSLGGYMELLRDEDLDAETQREFLEIMDRQIRRLQKLATDLLDLSRIDTGTLEINPENVALGELARAVAREFEPRALQHGSALAVHADNGVQTVCDPDRVAQVLRILVDNALSHTPVGTAIDVSVQAENGLALVSVADNGPGIPEEELPRIFERFHTGDRSGGTGLGLSIAREIATAMGSELAVTSQPSNTVFILTLPTRWPK
jgi:signal transduction histidine kinase